MRVVAREREFDLDAVRAFLEKNLEARGGRSQPEAVAAGSEQGGLKFNGGFGFETRDIAKVPDSSARRGGEALVGIHL